MREVTFYNPGKRFPAVSITGKRCELDCLHCGGRYLSGMVPVTSPGELVEFSRGLAAEGGNGILLSGGCDRTGKVDFSGLFDAIETIKGETSLIINAHIGIGDAETIGRLVDAGVDVVSADVVGDTALIEKVYGVRVSDARYDDYLSALGDIGKMAVPHICLGLDGGVISSEMDAIESIKGHMDPARLVFLVLVPTGGTAWESVTPPNPWEVGELIARARERLPKARLLLGCMRPRGKGYGASALENGIDGIVVPSRETRQLADQMGLSIIEKEACCAV